MRVRDVTRASLFTALAVCSAMTARFAGNTVPFSLLPLMSVLSGTLLGKRLGAVSMGLYALMGLIGFPVFATAPFGGPGYLVKPTFGFILGFIAGAYLSGWSWELTSAGPLPARARYILGGVVGMMGIYAIGVPYLWLVLNLVSGESVTAVAVVRMGLTPFILADLVKAVAAGVLSAEILRRVPHGEA